MTSYSENGVYIAIAGWLVSMAAHYGIVIQSSDSIALVGSIVAVAGAIHLWYNSRKAKNAAVANGVKFK